MVNINLNYYYLNVLIKIILYFFYKINIKVEQHLLQESLVKIAKIEKNEYSKDNINLFGNSQVEVYLKFSFDDFLSNIFI